MTDSYLRMLFEESVRDFADRVHSPADVFKLVRADTPELPRYLKTLRVAAAHAAGKTESLRLCDLGGYYGVVTRAMAQLGYESHLVDAFGPLMDDPSHADLRQWWDSTGLNAHDIDLQSRSLRLPFDDSSFDLVTLLAVIEHFPHSPRLVLEEARRILRPDGLLVVDTPNAGAFGNRIGFFRHGEGLWAPIRDLYASEIPFPGHKRCYSRRELVAVLKWAGLEPTDVVVFDPDGRVKHSGSLSARLLYDGVYPLIAPLFPDLRDYLWVSARRRRE